MNIVNIHIDETLDAGRIEELKKELMRVPHVCNVEMNPAVPHDLMVEYEEHHDMPMTLLSRLSQQGLHTDIEPC